jgi:hypothetical protein
MANTFLKANRIAGTALGLLEREIMLPGLVWRDAGGDFRGAGGDTISIRVPARTTARTRALRGTRPSASEGNGIITLDELTETKVDVTLDTAVYSAVPVTDEELTLDLTSFGDQILGPQVRAVAEGIENAVAAEMTGATYAVNLTIDTTDPYKTLVDAQTALNKSNIPRGDRVVVCGPDVENVILKSDHLARYDQSGSDDALRRARMGQIANFPIYVSNALPSNMAIAFHKTAFVLGMRAPEIPAGVNFGSSQNGYGLAMRWIRDYDFRNVLDRSLVDTYIGTNIVADGSNEAQSVTITGAPTGGTFTLTWSGQTTAAIAYNASASVVESRLEALSNTNPGDVTVTGPAGGPWIVTFQTGTDVAQMTATSSLTGGTSPAVAVATTQAGGSGSFVRAVKLLLP